MEAGSRPRRLPGRVIVVGSINFDLVLRLPRLPKAGETVTGGSLERHHGGKGANQAVAAARAGAEVHLIGAVGEDDGQAALDALAAERVNISAIARLPGQHTGHAVVMVEASSGENQIAVAPGANAAVTTGHVKRCVDALRLTGPDVIVLSFELMDPPLLAAAAAARGAGATLVVNPAPARECDPEVLRGAVLTPNRHEAMVLGSGHHGTADVAKAASVLSGRGEGPVIATLGEQGALLADGASAEYFPGHRVTARDTTGAGDTLTGVLAAGLAEGRDLRVALRRAVAAAAIAVTCPGAREGMPAAGDIDALLAADRSPGGRRPQG
jgi:ribokinase